MQILVVDGWTQEGNAEHVRAGCVTQARVFELLIKENLPDATITIVNTDVAGASVTVDLEHFAAVVWTGGGGNIYKDNEFNREQLSLCERVLADVPFYWGSCWGLQVVVSVLGGVVGAARVPEIGIASDIVIGSSEYAQTLFHGKPSKFDAPAHHGDEVKRLPQEFTVIAENDVTLQAVTTSDGTISCTQYHPEIPYDYVKKLLIYWAPNYKDIFTAHEFDNLLARLTKKEQVEEDSRKIEFKNWLAFISN